jgi:DeoR family transcriptional regulator, copper-sensing transcriptional repressor
LQSVNYPLNFVNIHRNYQHLTTRFQALSDLPSVRQSQILEWLQETSTLTIEQLAERLQVSIMTVHRDLNELARTGRVAKVHGGVTLPSSISTSSPATCALCEMHVNGRTTFGIQTQSGDQLQSCCPHCGFLLLGGLKNVTSVLVRDFLYGRMINAWQASYLLESDVQLCCLPSVLCFANRTDAKRFQSGFKGRIADFTETQHELIDHHGKVGSQH